MSEVERLAQAIVQRPYDEDDLDDWMALFEWHRAEGDIDKARAAASVIARRYRPEIDPDRLAVAIMRIDTGDAAAVTGLDTSMAAQHMAGWQSYARRVVAEYDRLGVPDSQESARSAEQIAKQDPDEPAR